MTDDSPIKGFGPETFGQLNAEHYDRNPPPAEATLQAVEFLADLARGGSVLEFATGTGRVALPLAERGLRVSGVEASPEMVAKLLAKPGGEAIAIMIGDMTEAAPDGDFDLVFLVFNTLFNLTTQDAQVRCFQNAARHLSPHGAFVIETVVPDIAHFTDPARVKTMHVAMDQLMLEASVHDPVRQVIRYMYVTFGADGRTRLTPLPWRYAWPAELDLMARLAGLELRERWGDWDRSAFTARSEKHVSVYGLPRGGQTVSPASLVIPESRDSGLSGTYSAPAGK